MGSANRITDSYSLSPIQQGMLFHYLSGAHSGVDIEQIVCRLDEAIDTDILARAWQTIAVRHPALRTAFRWEGVDQPLQDVHAEVELPFVVNDWCGQPADVQQRQLDEFLASDRAAGFDLELPPLIRLTFFHTGDASGILVWTFHHLLLDGRSFPVVLREVFAACEALASSQPVELPTIPLYQQHIGWLEKRDTSGDENFWRELLQGVSGPTPLPMLVQAEDDAEATIDRVEIEIRLGSDLSDSLITLADDEKVSLNTVLQAAWAILLSRYTGERQVVFGSTRAGRHTVDGANDIVGMFINTLPVPVTVDPDITPASLMKILRQQDVDMRPFEHTALVDIHQWSDVPAATPLFDTLVIYDHAALDQVLKADGDAWANRHFKLLDKTNLPLTLYAYGEDQLLLNLVYDRNRLSDIAMGRLLGHLQSILAAMASESSITAGNISLLTEAERHRQLVDWNDTGEDYQQESRIHDLISQQAASLPDKLAVAAKGRELSYRELDEVSNRLARHLQSLGAGPDVPVGIHMHRSVDMLTGLLAIMKAGSAYLPLDPDFPADRLAFMLEDARAPLLLTESQLEGTLPAGDYQTVVMDTDRATWEANDGTAVQDEATADNLAYVIYTSGSTGKPKGVMVEHGNVVNFFVGMDQSIARGERDAWLAVTSLSFDISVLELLWTLARGFTVVMAADIDAEQKQDEVVFDQEIDFSLFYFASDDGGTGRDKYRLLLEGAKFADRNGFVAVWTPERHFHAFGGIFPNPSVAGAAVAAVTENLQIRSGSCVLPLHNPIRVAEEWAVVDNLSNGGVGIGFASGWQPNDFVLAPENYPERQAIMFEHIETVRKLWRGEAVKCRNPKGDMVEIRTMPRPVQKELPVWVTTAGSIETYISAGKSGANVLTHLLGQAVEDLEAKIKAYRQAWKEAGHPGQGSVTLMLHTFVGDDNDEVREIVRQPMKNYLGSALSLVKGFADSWSAFKKDAAVDVKLESNALDQLSDEEIDSLLDFSFERYFETSSLYGTPEKCLKLIKAVQDAGVDEVSCLIDFGVDHDLVLEHLDNLNEVRAAAQPAAAARTRGESLPEQISKYDISHLQCTPSMARMLLLNDETRAALAKVEHILIGGEALPVDLTNEVQEVTQASITNMYGPTETTIWSSTQVVNGEDQAGTVAIGKPIANTTMYVLDGQQQPVPVGIVGELYIGGDGVVRGYHDRPELTAERFVANPFDKEGNSRLYRTGDLVRFRDDGVLEFIGRVDHQVKVRGFRIELGEIEAALLDYPGIAEAVVIAREDIPGDKRLVAYLVSDTEPDQADLRTHLGTRLPDYMVPSNFIAMDAFPLTPNRKIDRKALPSPSDAGISREEAFAPPSSEMEKMVAGVWEEVLNLPDIGVQDNFFELGGHSILAVKLHGLLRKLSERKLMVTDIFRYPTIRAYAEFLSGEDSSGEQVQKSMDRGASRRAALQRRRGRRGAGSATTGDTVR
ncbi:MAG: LLM class flavin-dependent oxidoreductase [Gammaproteobacteria bacterium]|nr:LLM class flavin-dependent oxidoreductase [Gammaproteobacteria bacterium]